VRRSPHIAGGIDAGHRCGVIGSDRSGRRQSRQQKVRRRGVPVDRVSGTNRKPPGFDRPINETELWSLTSSTRAVDGASQMRTPRCSTHRVGRPIERAHRVQTQSWLPADTNAADPRATQVGLQWRQEPGPEIPPRPQSQKWHGGRRDRHIAGIAQRQVRAADKRQTRASTQTRGVRRTTRRRYNR